MKNEKGADRSTMTLADIVWLTAFYFRHSSANIATASPIVAIKGLSIVETWSQPSSVHL